MTTYAPKSRSSRRDVQLAADDVAAMRRHLLASGRPHDGALVFALEGEAPSPVPAYRGFRRACFRAGVLLDGAPDELRRCKTYAAFQRRCRELEIAEPLPRFHDTRHAYATHALAAGLSAHAVARLLGHSDAGLVWRRYGHALPGELARAAEVLNVWRSREAAG
jgi:integrase